MQEQNITCTLTSQERTQSITATAARERERRHWIRHRPKCILCGKAVSGIRGTLNFAHCRSRCTSYEHAAQISMFKAMNICDSARVQKSEDVSETCADASSQYMVSRNQVCLSHRIRPHPVFSQTDSGKVKRNVS